MPLTNILTAITPTFSRGISIAFAGMCIVAVALTLISLFIAAMPRLLTAINEVWPEVEDRHAKPSHPESLVPDDDRVLAAIGYVLHCEFQKQLRNETSGTGKG